MKGCSLEEGLTATYIRALEPDCFDFYNPRTIPLVPYNFRQDFKEYEAIKDLKDKSDAWRTIAEKHKVYLRELEEIVFKNVSDIQFLNDMEKHFRKIGMISYAQKCAVKIATFEQFIISLNNEKYFVSKK